ncbi:hypothetical protein DICVIV_09608 [Dictyocaulus viviparus]|uniref:Uncharacterized protein n=1 Tax=Dictyocaulus viviparus TaxID=29172 RepID=A0A0D8XIF3_DICVI|nr:hypothetical protein DICVIV_09608 [Dictyocaulus viviparus]
MASDIGKKISLLDMLEALYNLRTPLTLTIVYNRL